jgi:hypothetical protein
MIKVPERLKGVPTPPHARPLHDEVSNMSGASSVFRMGNGVMDKWKVFRRKSCDFAALVLKIDSDNEQVVVSHSDV